MSISGFVDSNSSRLALKQRFNIRLLERDGIRCGGCHRRSNNHVSSGELFQRLTHNCWRQTRSFSVLFDRIPITSDGGQDVFRINMLFERSENCFGRQFHDSLFQRRVKVHRSTSQQR